jgi:hypothetical protein
LPQVGMSITLVVTLTLSICQTCAFAGGAGFTGRWADSG